jgi:hypothetical protein
MVKNDSNTWKNICLGWYSNKSKKMKITSLLFSMLILSIGVIKAQNVSFTNSNNLLTGNAVNYRSGNAVGVTDVNNDGLDDIVRLDQSTIH